MTNYGIDLATMDYGSVLDDLAAEGQELDDLVSAETDWTRPTPAVGWSIAHEIAHLAWSDRNALVAIRTPQDFTAELERARAAGERYADDAADAGAAKPRTELLNDWRAGRAELLEELRKMPQDKEYPWYGSTMTAGLAALVRVMETWAHGDDIYVALGVVHRPTARLRPIAQLGVLGRDLSFGMAGRTPPSEPIRVELTAPRGDTWAWGPEAAPQRLSGPALDFCLLVTHRRRLTETDLVATGDDAQAWLDTARVFSDRTDLVA
jgi:uncharacterized protein (TIGR03084 family)